MADPLTGAAVGIPIGLTVKYALDKIKRGRKFRSTRKTIEETLDALAPFVEKIKVSNDSLDRPREDIRRLETHIRELKELVEKSKELTWRDVLSFSHYQAKLQTKFEGLQIHLSINVQVEIQSDLTMLLVKVGEISENMLTKNDNLGQFHRGWCGAPEEPQCIGMDEPLTKLRTEMMKDGVSVLVLAGLGGSGKTTIAKKLCWDQQIKDKFRENIFFFTVSKTPNLKNIVQTLFQHCRHGVPKFQTDEDAINQLGHLLKQIGSVTTTTTTTTTTTCVPVLLVLDDVWPDSEGLVEKFIFQMSDYKILVTSRVAFERFGTPCHLNPLDPDNASSLFQHYAQLNKRSSMPDSDLLDEIVKGCKGWPLALQVTAGSLCQQPIEKWKDMKERMKSQTIFESNDANLLSCLQQSLDISVDINEKNCFVDLGLFPEDQMIPVTVLIDMWATLYGLDEDGTKAMVIIQDLKTRNLIRIIATGKVATETDMYYNNHYVVIHDLLRELANHQRKEESFKKRLIIDLNGDDRPDWWIGPNQQGMISCMHSFVAGLFLKQKQLKVDARILSISTDETFSSDWCDMQPDEAEVLILNLRSKKYSLPNFTKKMSKLEVLIVTNYGFHCSELIKFELLGLLSNLKRIRLEKVSVPCLSILKKLQKLSLYMCNTGNAFESCSFQISDSMPNLVELSIDYSKDLIKLPDGLWNITTMKKLSITNCHKLSAIPQDIGKLENLEVLRLSSCSDLNKMPESVAGLTKLRCLDISDCVILPTLPDDIGELKKLKTLSMKGCSVLSVLPDSVIYFGNLNHEMLVICDEERVALWERFPNIPNIKIVIPKVEINLNWLHGTHS